MELISPSINPKNKPTSLFGKSGCRWLLGCRYAVAGIFWVSPECSMWLLGCGYAVEDVALVP